MLLFFLTRWLLGDCIYHEMSLYFVFALSWQRHHVMLSGTPDIIIFQCSSTGIRKWLILRGEAIERFPIYLMMMSWLYCHHSAPLFHDRIVVHDAAPITIKPSAVTAMFIHRVVGDASLAKTLCMSGG
mmetsp:Transcript_37750/g.75219  ORF Transcript_37750/g.75219 Transcript_37750/m.75219 type:complete len:128 (-) Transcript_37750:1532-1915(-)